MSITNTDNKPIPFDNQKLNKEKLNKEKLAQIKKQDVDKQAQVKNQTPVNK